MLEPCEECPFLRKSVQGKLIEFSNKPEAFLQQLEKGIYPCHVSIDFEKRKYDNAVPCAGAMQFMNNHNKLFKEDVAAHVQKSYGKNDQVFTFRHEFIDHHSKKDG
jgi:hypothetical protein